MVYPLPVTISVVLITQDEEANLPNTLESVMPLVRDGQGEIVIVDSGSTDRTLEIARSYGAKIFSEPWKGFAEQKNSAMQKASCDWVLQLDADEALTPELAKEIHRIIEFPADMDGEQRKRRIHDLAYVFTSRTLRQVNEITQREGAKTRDYGSFDRLSGFWIPRKNFFLGRWIKHGGFYPDPKLRLVRRGAGKFEEYGAHPTMKVDGPTGQLKHALIHNAYPTLRGYIDHMNRYSSSGAGIAQEKGHRDFSFTNVVLRPLFTFVYNYFFRLGFLDGREGLLLHLYHSVYVSWKYAKAWEIARRHHATTAR
ncbi:MAG TPA: glycosyltransferase family 2 protein [Terriglobales bacterium]|nr:glycosyltransferase family 2 protein [Terriglobales bacterium]